MGFYRVREPIEARRFEDHDTASAVDLAEWCGGCVGIDGNIRVFGQFIAYPGNWIVRYIGGSFGVLSATDFHATYVEIDQ